VKTGHGRNAKTGTFDKAGVGGQCRTSAAGKAIYCAAVPMARLNCALKVSAVADFEIAHARAQRLNDARAVEWGTMRGNSSGRWRTLFVVGGVDCGGAQPTSTSPGPARVFPCADSITFSRDHFFRTTCQHVILRVSGDPKAPRARLASHAVLDRHYALAIYQKGLQAMSL